MIDATKVDAAVDDLFGRAASEGRSHALLVQQAGETVAERYGLEPANDFAPEKHFTAQSTLLSWSIAKSIVHAAIGILVADERVDLDAPAPVPEWHGTPKASITMLDLLNMRSGLAFNEDYMDDQASHCIAMLFGDSGPSHAAYAADLRLDHPPGTVWNYSSGTSNILSRIIGDIVGGSAGGDPDTRAQTVERFLVDRLFAPVSMRSAVPKFDAAGDFVGSSYLYATAADFARFATLYLNDGVAESGARILPAGWADHARVGVGFDEQSGFVYGRHWWTWPGYDNSLAALGYEGQFVAVVPNKDLVLVHLGKTDAATNDQLWTRLRRIIDLY